MSTASPAPFSPPRSPVPGRGLAPYEVLDVSLEDDIDDLPVSPATGLAADDDEFGGLFIALSTVIPAGLAFWAAVVAVLIW